MSSIIAQLASTLGRKDEAPNTELATRIAGTNDTKAVKELTELLAHKNKEVQSDAIKVLYETGEQNPALIAPHAATFLALLQHKNNRLVWGAMTALDSITAITPDAIHEHLPTIMDAAGKGSVIAKDHFISILIRLAGIKKYEEDMMTLLLDQFKASATNQLPMYAEQALTAIPPTFKNGFIAVLTHRLPDIEKESKRKRVEKVIRKLQQ